MSQQASKTVNNFYTFAGRPVAALALIAAAGLTGCEHDGYLDPRQVGRWEHTPTSVPVLTRLACVEGPAVAGVDVGSGYGEPSRISREDLIPEVDAYRGGPGDNMEVKILDLYRPDFEERYDRTIDPRGFIDLPKVGSLYVDNLTADEMNVAISQAYRTKGILNNPNIDVNIVARRKLTYNIIGGVTNPGTYAIPRPEFRLLEAVSQGGRFSENVQWIYVVRGTPLSDAAAGRFRPNTNIPVNTTGTDAPATIEVPAPAPAAQPNNGNKQPLIDLIDQLGQPAKNPGSPGMLPQPTGDNRSPVPVIDIDSVNRVTTTTTASTYTTTTSESASSTGTSGKWQFVNGQWVASSNASSGTAQNTSSASTVLSQRVLQIPMSALLAGSPQYNVVIRPGDIVRIPSTNEGIVYVHGNVNRPGVYQLPATSQLTLIRAIASAGDLNDIGIPERVDLTRFLGEGRQATVRLNYRAIAEGTQPDVYLRDGDVINVGTNFWATPLAVIRNGFRASYGFGFTLDRNFGYDVFGPQKTNQNF